jgi:hypothetical protein
MNVVFLLSVIQRDNKDNVLRGIESTVVGNKEKTGRQSPHYSFGISFHQHYCFVYWVDRACSASEKMRHMLMVAEKRVEEQVGS